MQIGKMFFVLLLLNNISIAQIDIKNVKIEGEYKLPNILPALDYEDDMHLFTYASKYLPIEDSSFIEQVRTPLTTEENQKIDSLFNSKTSSFVKYKFVNLISGTITSIQHVGKYFWIATEEGLYYFDSENKVLTKQKSYGVDGPLSTFISDMVVDSKGSVWVGTPIGLCVSSSDGTWKSIRGSEGLPVEHITALEIDKNDRLWIGTTEGAILYTPYAKGRKWFYRAGKRYLINDVISKIIISDAGMPVYFKTEKGISKIDAKEINLFERAEIIENRINKWHRRLGMIASCVFDDAENPTSKIIRDNDNDGLWTSYHVVAMSLAYATTNDIKYLESAKESMHALIMLQNASGIPGLVARSVLPIEFREMKSSQWRETPDGKWLWKSDTSSDEIDGHFFAFYAYWEHIAKYDAKESAIIKEQISEVMNYIVDNNYQLIDWDGERTRWGFWNPELLNDEAEHYMENGLNSAQILSFLKVSYYITGNESYKKHYDKLIVDHGYLANILLEKKVAPDANNHSDNQLGYCALYPLLQLEFDAKARNALQRTVRRHYRTLNRDGSAFFYFATATIDPDFVDILSGVENLRQTPTDRRQWKTLNSNRKDITWSPFVTRFNKRQLLNVLPADERNVSKWNSNPYYPDGGSSGKLEDDGASWLLAYWMGRFHGFISE